MLFVPLIAAVLTPAPPIHRVEVPMRLPAAARPYTAAIAVDRAQLEAFAQQGGGLLELPLANTRVAVLDLHPCNSVAEDARIEAVSRAKDGTLQSSPVAVRGAFLSGTIVGEPDTHAFLAVSDAGNFGYVETPTHTYIITSGRFGSGMPTVSYDLTSMPPGLVETPAWTCATEAPKEPPVAPQGDGGIAGTPPCRQVRLALETDYEFLQLFGGNTTAAAGYIGTLTSALTAIYTRDFNVRFATVYSRLWTTDADPWTAPDMVAELTEFRVYWDANMVSTARDLAHFLSGRGLGGGVAYLPGLCDGTPYGVSANLGGYFPTPLVDNNGSNWDIMVVAHELGHNFGAPHTHSYSPPLDGCGSSPQDCTVAAAGNGTIMSYCHLCSGGLANIKLQFHPANIATVEQHFASAQCDFTGPGRPPLAFSDRVNVAATVPVLIDVLANEIDVNCESVSIEFPLTTTANGGEIALSAGSGPNGRDQVSYRMPNPNFNGNDAFVYRLRDASNGTAVASVIPTVTAVRSPENPIGATPQLSVGYYALTAPSVLPDFAALTPYATGLVPDINFASTSGNFAGSGRADDVGAVFTGWVDVPTGGVWTFFLNSDDGSRLKIGSTVVVLNDGLHAMTEASGSIALAAGRHAFRVEFFERGGGAGVIASWQGPGVAKEAIPAAKLLHGGVDIPADINNDGAVNAIDLANVLGAWGSVGGPADLNRSGTVEAGDLAIILNAWTG